MDLHCSNSPAAPLRFNQETDIPKLPVAIREEGIALRKTPSLESRLLPEQQWEKPVVASQTHSRQLEVKVAQLPLKVRIRPSRLPPLGPVNVGLGAKRLQLSFECVKDNEVT